MRSDCPTTAEIQEPLFLPLVPHPSLSAYTLSFPLLPLPTMAARPATSHFARPTTAGPLDPSMDSESYLDRDPQYTFSQEYSQEDQDDESDDEDVFAFLPPSTAQDEQTPSFPPPVHSHPLSQPPFPEPSFPQEYLPASLSSPASPPPPFSPAPDSLIYPPPSFDPNALERRIPQAGPSTTSVHFIGAVESPPSTSEPRDSYSSADDAFRLRKFPTCLSTTTDFTTDSSQFPLDDKRRSFSLQEKRRQATAMSEMSTVDPEFDGADSVSIKFVHLPPVYRLY